MHTQPTNDDNGVKNYNNLVKFVKQVSRKKKGVSEGAVSARGRWGAGSFEYRRYTFHRFIY